jgi:hypothetical protein
MKTSFKIMNAQEIINLIISGKLNTNPIGQRPPVTRKHTKSSRIIKAMLEGYGIGMFTIRDIREDKAAKEIYPNADYLVIDGGHRGRALRDFYMNKFIVNGFTSAMMEDLNFSDFDIPVQVCICTDSEATQLFRYVNTNTPVNFMEQIMSDDVSNVLKEIRIRTSYYKEYDNKEAPLFEVVTDSRGDQKSKYFDMEPNLRRKWDEWVAIAMIKSQGGGNVDAGQTEIELLAEEESVSKQNLSVVDRCLDDIQKIAQFRTRKLNTDIFAALQLVWFGLYGQNRSFKISDYKQFQKEFMRVYSLLTGNNDKLAFEFIDFKGERESLKKFFRANQRNFSSSEKQSACFDEFMKLTSLDQLSVTFRDDRRSVSTKDREEMLALQGYRCYIDGQPLELSESVFGHDTPWAEGGQIEEGKVIRATHNRNMGTMTIEDYREWYLMKAKAA